MRLSSVATRARHVSAKKIDALNAAFVAFILGAIFVYGAGFMDVESIHDAAHDSRHALSFPCH